MRRAGRPDLLLLHLHKVLLEPFLHPLAVVGRDARKDVMVISRYPSASFRHYPLKFVLECSSPAPRGGRRDLPWSLVISLSRLAARTVLFLPVKTVSADPPEAINFSNFFQHRKHCSY
jgi:hypothetical protein